MLRRLLVLVIVLWVGAEIAAPPLVESRVESRVRAETADLTAVDADVRSLPLIARTLATGRVQALDVTLEEVAGTSVPIARLTAGLRGVVVDRQALLAGDLEIERVDDGRLSAEITRTALTDVLGATVELEVGLADEVPIPERLLPCDPEARVDGDRLVLECRTTRIPAWLQPG